MSWAWPFVSLFAIHFSIHVSFNDNIREFPRGYLPMVNPVNDKNREFSFQFCKKNYLLYFFNGEGWYQMYLVLERVPHAASTYSQVSKTKQALLFSVRPKPGFGIGNRNQSLNSVSKPIFFRNRNFQFQIFFMFPTSFLCIWIFKSLKINPDLQK